MVKIYTVDRGIEDLLQAFTCPLGSIVETSYAGFFVIQNSEDNANIVQLFPVVTKSDGEFILQEFGNTLRAGEFCTMATTVYAGA